jgi:hypothetical protein
MLPVPFSPFILIEICPWLLLSACEINAPTNAVGGNAFGVGVGDGVGEGLGLGGGFEFVPGAGAPPELLPEFPVLTA